MKKLRIIDYKKINGKLLKYTIYQYNERRFELTIQEGKYRRHLKDKEAAVAFLTDVDTKNYLEFKKECDSLPWEIITEVWDYKIKEVEYNNGKQLTIWS